MKKFRLPYILKKFDEVFLEHGHSAYLVGGAVRDMLMGKEAHDWDIATDASPMEVMSMFRKVIPTGIAHGTVTVRFLKHEIEVTTFRTESEYSDGRHPDKVSFSKNLEEDLGRRDFTMNAIAISLRDGHLEDPFGGRKDIKKRVIKTVGDASERFSEDGLRPVRAIRFSSTLGFSIEKRTFEAMQSPSVLEKVKGISIERFRDEFKKLLLSEKPSVSLRLMESTKILSIFIPELADCRGCSQKDFRGFHDFDVLDHLFHSCDGSPKEKLNVRLSALFHDIGKPGTKKTVSVDGMEKFTFYGHEKLSSKIARKVLFRLRFPNSLIENVCHLIENHMFHYEENWTDAAVRRFIVRVGYENIEDLFDLRISDVYGMHGKKIMPGSDTLKNLLEFSERIEKIKAEKSALSLKDLCVNGKSLMELGIPSGKDIGLILERLMESVLDDPSLNTEESLLKLASNIWNERNKISR